jgi:putative ABC transport system permease protein
VQLTLPSFNNLTGKKIDIPFSSIGFWLLMAVSIMFTTLAAGSRPAFYLSSFQPINVLKGKLNVGKGASLPRKILVVLQFSCSIALIISTIIIYQQIQYSKNRPTGYDINRLIITYTNSDLSKNYTALKNELLQAGIVSDMTRASGAVTQINWHSDVDQWQGKQAGETIEMGTIKVGDDYFKTLGITIQEGRVFTGPADTLNAIFNEAAVKSMRLKAPLGQTIIWGERPYKIIGIAKNSLMSSPFAPAEPTMFMYETGSQSSIMYRLSPNIKTADAIAKLTAAFNKYSPAFPYTYRFADEAYAEKFNLEVLVGKLAGIFAALAIFISCLGLFGLAAYIAEQRTKEIGIRKVLGATVSQVWLLLSKDFLLLVLISCVIASPVAFYFLQNWLDKYSYRINIGVGVFVLSACVSLAITVITISFQAIKAALANPVKSLRTE